MFHLNLVAWLFHHPQSTYRHAIHRNAGLQRTRPTTPKETIILRLTVTRRNAGERMGATRLPGDPPVDPGGSNYRYRSWERLLFQPFFAVFLNRAGGR